MDVDFPGIARDLLNARPNAGRMLLIVALTVGVLVRFYRLSAVPMTADEGAAWAAAIEPVHRLLVLQPVMDPGKLALYDLLLHYWIRIFGDGLASLRSLSATLDTISIFLIFAVLREAHQAFDEEGSETAEHAGGFAALLFATNAVLVESARNARMYPLALAAELAQILYFIRAQHHNGVVNCILAAVFLALAVAANFTAIFLVAAETVWLAYLLITRWRSRSGVQLRIVGPGLALAAGLSLLVLFAAASLVTSRGALNSRAVDWIRYRSPLRWSYDVLHNSAANKSLFKLLVALAAFGTWRYWRRTSWVPIFLLVLVVTPFALVAILSLFGRPLMVDRYVLLAQVAFLGLAALGAAAFNSRFGRLLVLVLIIWLSARALRRWSGFWVDWRTAVAIDSAKLSHDATIDVVPSYAANVVRYYLPPDRRALAHGLGAGCGDSRVLIISPGHLTAPSYMSELNACYPRLLGRATRVEVRSNDDIGKGPRR